MKPLRHLWIKYLLALTMSATPLANAQARYTATRPGDLQAGGSVDLVNSKYLPWDTDGNSAPLSDLSRNVRSIGGGAYVAFDFKEHWGAEFNFHHVNASNDSSKQTTFELGGRYILTHKFRFAPYARASFGRGLYGYPNNLATLGYNLYGFAGGTDYNLSRSFNLRLEYEYQSWMSVPVHNPQPQVVTIGIAYHFHDR